MHAALWQSDFWLPEGVTWQDIHTSAGDLWFYSLLVAIMFLFFRYWCLQPLLDPLAKCWFQRRHNFNYKEVIDHGFHLFCHILFAVVGACVTLPKPWLRDTTLCWKDFPNHEVTSDIFWYFMIMLGYYWAIMIMDILPPSRQNPTNIKITFHHIVTVLLIVFTWICGLIRIATLILFIHEYSDVALHAKKMCKYAGYKKASELFSVAFCFLWVLTRCCVLPWMALSIFLDAGRWIKMPALFLYQFLFLSLLSLTFIWTLLLIRSVVRKVRSNMLHIL